MKEIMRPPTCRKKAAEIGGKEAAKRIIDMHKKGKKAHEIATTLGVSEMQVYRIVKDYEKRISDKGRLSMISAFGMKNEEESVSAVKSALGNLGFKKG